LHQITEEMLLKGAKRLNNRLRLKFLTMLCVVHLQLDFTAHSAAHSLSLKILNQNHELCQLAALVNLNNDGLNQAAR
jgi:hypothetical protein